MQYHNGLLLNQRNCLWLYSSHVIFFFFPQLLDCLSIWSPKVRKKTSSTKIVFKAPVIIFSPSVAMGGQWGRGYFTISLGKMRKSQPLTIYVGHTTTERRIIVCPFPIKRKQNWPTPKFSLLSISKTLYATENQAVSVMSCWIVVFAQMKNLCKIDKHFTILLANILANEEVTGMDCH